MAVALCGGVALPRPQAARRSPCAALAKAPAPRLGQGYAAVSLLTLLAWSVASVMALARHPAVVRLPLRHNVLTVAQALTPLPLAAAVLASLTNSARTEGWWAMNRMTYRRLNLAVAFVSAWLAAAAAFAPHFARGYKLYPAPCGLLLTACHLFAGLFCLAVWRRSAPRALPGLLRGLLGSAWALLPATSETATISAAGSASHLDDPESTAGSDGRNEYSMAALLFASFAFMPFLVPFPFAGVATLGLGPLSRAGAAWSFLAAVAAYVLKDATQRGRIHSGKTFRFLRWGFVASSGSHLLLVLLTLAGADGGRGALMKFYPGTMSCPKLALLSLLMHALVVFAALTPPPKIATTVATPVATPVAAPVAVPSAPPVAVEPPPMAVVEPPPVAVVEPPPPVVTSTAPGAFSVDQRVSFRGQGGTVRYIGETNVGAGEWIGVEMDEEIGTHDGSLFGVRYFTCKARHGVFAQAGQLHAA